MNDAATNMTLASADEDGQRLHIAGLLVGFVNGLPRLIFPTAAALFGAGRSDRGVFFMPFIIAAVVGFSLFFRWLSWLRFRYYIGAHDIRIESGVLSRNARSIPYERIQDVSIEQKPLARVMGLTEVKFETGGGDGDDAKLSFVSMAEAENLRDLVRTRKSGAALAGEPEVAITDNTPPIFAMDSQRVFTFGLYSFSLFIFAVMGGLAQQFDSFLPFDLWDIRAWTGIAEDRGITVDQISHVAITAQIIFGVAALAGLLLIGLASGVIRTTLREHGFRLDRTEKGFRRRRGLLTLTDVVMPAHRVQAAVIQTGPFRKRRGWHALKFVSLAQDSKDETNFVAAPFATLAEIWPIAHAAIIDAPDGETDFRRGAGKHWSMQLWIVLPVVLAAMIAAIWFADVSPTQSILLLLMVVPFVPVLWLDWRGYHYGLDGRQIYVRRGWWRQRLIIAPQVKVQTVEIRQGPISRRQGLASLHFGIAGGTLEMIALPLENAREIRDAVMERVAAVDYSVVAKG